MTKLRPVIGASCCTLLLAACVGQGKQGEIEPPLAVLTSPASGQPAVEAPACPQRFAEEDHHAKSTVPGIGKGLIPGHPDVMRLCDFAALSSDQKRSQRVLNDVTVRSDLSTLVTELDSTERAPHGVFNCPADYGKRDVLRFRYDDGAALDVVVEFGGCRLATNGRSTWLTSTKILRDLNRLARGRNLTD